MISVIARWVFVSITIQMTENYRRIIVSRSALVMGCKTSLWSVNIVTCQVIPSECFSKRSNGGKCDKLYLASCCLFCKLWTINLWCKYLHIRSKPGEIKSYKGCHHAHAHAHAHAKPVVYAHSPIWRREHIFLVEHPEAPKPCLVVSGDKNHQL